MRHAMRIDPLWRPLLLVGGVTPGRAWVDVTASAVEFRFGFTFHETVPRDDIVAAAPRDWPLLGGIGGRWTFGGEIGLIGSRSGVVQVRLASKQRVRLIGLPVRVDRVSVSLEDPDAFIRDLAL